MDDDFKLLAQKMGIQNRQISGNKKKTTAPGPSQ